jgi:hypothetical protein
MNTMDFCGVASDAFPSRTGFSRERAGVDTMGFFCGVTSDAFPSRTGFSREEAGKDTMDFCGVASDAFPAKAGPTNGMRRAPCDVFQWDRLQPGKGRYGHHGFWGVASDRFPSRTGFSRERAGVDTMGFFCGVTSDAFPAKAGPTNGMRRAPCDVFL